MADAMSERQAEIYKLLARCRALRAQANGLSEEARKLRKEATKHRAKAYTVYQKARKADEEVTWLT